MSKNVSAIPGPEQIPPIDTCAELVYRLFLAAYRIWRRV